MDKKIITPGEMNNNKQNIIVTLLKMSKEIAVDRSNIKVLLKNIYTILIILGITPEKFFETLTKNTEIEDYDQKVKDLATEFINKKNDQKNKK